MNGWVVAHRLADEPVELWRREYRNFAQMIVWADTGELLIEDSDIPEMMGGVADHGSVVIVDIETGEERAERRQVVLLLACSPVLVSPVTPMSVRC